MRDTLLTEGDMGQHNVPGRLSVGDTQSFHFKPTDSGPFYLSPVERERRRQTQGTGEFTVRGKTKPELMAELIDKGANLSNRGWRISELKERAQQMGIELVKREEKQIEGCEGAPKGVLQVLYERGHIDPNIPITKYVMKVPDRWRDEDGKIKQQHEQDVRELLLPEILARCDDFRHELTALEHLAELMSTQSSTVVVTFSPKYHCELAGCGVELSWGYAKKFYRQKISMDEKKSNFKRCVVRSLQTLTKPLVQRFYNRTRRYMKAYKAVEEGGERVTVEGIEKFVKQCKTHRSALDQDYGFITRTMQEAERETNP